jgi:hypothetical protein
MRPSEAAVLIGCSVQRVHGLISEGKIKATKKRVVTNQSANGSDIRHTCYHIEHKEVLRFMRVPVTGRGYPRGQPRIKVKRKKVKK